MYQNNNKYNNSQCSFSLYEFWTTSLNSEILKEEDGDNQMSVETTWSDSTAAIGILSFSL